MFLADNIAGRLIRENERLYDGEIGLMEDGQGRVESVSSCRIYEMLCKMNRRPESITISMAFIIEFEYQYSGDKAETKSGVKKLSARHDVTADRNELQGVFEDDFTVIPVIDMVTYDYSIPESGKSLKLDISVELQLIFSRSYYGSIYECCRKPPSGGKVESVNWMRVLENINIDDVLTLFENFARLLKIRKIFEKPEERKANAYDDRGRNELENDKRILAELNRSLEVQLKEMRETLAHLRHEINERNAIIDKLLTLLDQDGGKGHGPGMPRTTIS